MAANKKKSHPSPKSSPDKTQSKKPRVDDDGVVAPTEHKLLHLFRVPGLSEPSYVRLLAKAKEVVPGLEEIKSEMCFNIEVEGGSQVLSEEQTQALHWLLTETFEPDGFASTSFLSSSEEEGKSALVEVGPRLNFSTAWSSNAVSICAACGLESVTRLERSRRFLLTASQPIPASAVEAFTGLVHDRMTEMPYPAPLQSFESGMHPEPCTTIPVLEKGRPALEQINTTKGLGFDDWDLDYYTALFKDKLKRDPTDVELFDLGQANSEHSRHWFFGGKLVVDGQESAETLFQMVKATLPKENNSIIAFHDNSSSIRGFETTTLAPTNPGKPSKMSEVKLTLHPILTAETHNFPSGVAPFPGAETGTGGRLRDVQATGRGAFTLAGVSSYCVGNLRIPGYEQPWEDLTWKNAPNLASPLQIEIEASNGASDYGNKYGEPVIAGFTRSFGQRLPNGERVEWLKPIMFTAGVGQLNGLHTTKGEPEVGMWAVKVGGPAYRIGMGGGAASSRAQGDAATANLDFDAVQRGDAEMENKMNRLIRALIEMGEDNPIVSIHDQGAGGNGNVLKEIVDPLGARYEIRNIKVGDKTLSALEIWGAEYQENDALLIRSESIPLLEAVAQREKCPYSLVGQVTGDGRVVVHDSKDDTTPVDLPLSLVLGKMPQKTFVMDRTPTVLKPLQLEGGVTVEAALDRVLRLVSVGSKRFLTNKVDRSVTGLIAQQQCVGPLFTPLANVGVTAQSHFTLTGSAVSIGEQPIKGLVNPASMARMTVAEAITNMVWAKITALADIKASANWMWAAKLEGEGARLYDACKAMKDAFLALGAGIDGGKDSLSMACRVGEEVVKSPGTLTITAYAGVPDITLTVTPDLKGAPAGEEASTLLLVDLSGGKNRLGGTSLAQVYGQIGDEAPDMDDFAPLKNAFNVTQDLLGKKLILAGHDRSDGGLVVTLVEMAIAGNLGLSVDLPEAEAGGQGEVPADLALLFSEEAGLVVEVAAKDAEEVQAAYAAQSVPCARIGTTTSARRVVVRVGGRALVDQDVCRLRGTWEATSLQLERLQCNPDCVQQEEAYLQDAALDAPEFKLTYTPEPTPAEIMNAESKPKVAVLRQEGSNGDREMISAFHAAGFEAWDVTVQDLLNGEVTLDQFRGLVFVGGFSYADVLDSGKGWAGVIKFNKQIWDQFQAFKDREDTFSLGVCNGCQLMALLGWVPAASGSSSSVDQPRFVENHSGRFESRYSTVVVQDSPAIMLKDMAGSVLGVWVAHHEGRLHYPNPEVKEQVDSHHLAPLAYANNKGEPTEAYPFNPNGSPDGVTALCSADGRHLAMMPHPERCFQMWQCPWSPKEWKSDFTAGPWLKMFQNAFHFCSGK